MKPACAASEKQAGSTFNPPLTGMVVETVLGFINRFRKKRTFNPPLAGMVVETRHFGLPDKFAGPFNPPLAGMVVETALAGISAGAGF